MRRIKRDGAMDIIESSDLELVDIIVDDRAYSLTSILAATYEMQGVGYFYFDSDEDHKIIIHLILDKEKDKILIIKELKNQMLRFLGYEVNLSKRMKQRLLNNYQSYFSFEYKDCPNAIFSQRYEDLLNGVKPSDINDSIDDDCGCNKIDINKKENVKSSGLSEEIERKSIIKDSDFSEIKSTDKLEDVVVDDEEGISTPWEIKYGSTENE